MRTPDADLARSTLCSAFWGATRSMHRSPARCKVRAADGCA